MTQFTTSLVPPVPPSCPSRGATCPRKILVAVAWPYVNGPPHLGHIAGMNVPADIFVRYHRLAGNDAIMVSGSDMHGTPTALRAADEGVEPEVIARRYHKIWSEMPRRDGLLVRYVHGHRHR